jgi:hypothetical protein
MALLYPNKSTCRSSVLSALATVAIGLTMACGRGGPGTENPKCNIPKSITLPINLTPQELDQWCWAASGQMVMAYLGESVSQCGEADEFLQHAPADCCPAAAATNRCDTGGWPPFAKHKIEFLETNEGVALTLNQLTTEIGCKHLPVAFSWKWTGGGGHMMVAVGYNLLSAAPLIEVNDPWAPHIGSHHFYTYDDYVAAVGDHNHWTDMYNFVKQPR